MRILQLASYPLDIALHGGQKRALATKNYFEVKKDTVSHISHCSIFPLGSYHGDYFTDDNLTFKIDHDFDHMLGDVLASEYVKKDESLFNQLKDKVVKNKIDTILMEQPYLIGVYKELKAGFPDLKLIYNSHNKEVPLKEDIYNSIGLDPKLVNKYVSEIAKLEDDCVDSADLIIASSPSEYEFYSKKHTKVVLVLNGIDPIKELLPFRDESLRQITLPDSDFIYVLYVGSYHMPNIIGYEKLIGHHLGYLPPLVKLVVVGNVSLGIQDSANYKRDYLHSGSRITFLGRVSDEKLSMIYKHCQIVILPILSGEGTNLKTAEALNSNLPIVGTTHSFRGYEDLIKKHSGISIADEEDTFKRALLKTVSEIKEGKLKKRQSDKEVLWTERFKSLDRYFL